MTIDDAKLRELAEREIAGTHMLTYGEYRAITASYVSALDAIVALRTALAIAESDARIGARHLAALVEMTAARDEACQIAGEYIAQMLAVMMDEDEQEDVAMILDVRDVHLTRLRAVSAVTPFVCHYYVDILSRDGSHLCGEPGVGSIKTNPGEMWYCQKHLDAILEEFRRASVPVSLGRKP